MHKKLYCHPPDPPKASEAGPAATAEGPSPGEGANASRVLQTKTAGTQNITPDRHMDVKNKRWVNRWNGQGTKMRGQHQEKAENTRNMQPSPVTAENDLMVASVTWWVLKGCIMLHSVSAPPVQDGEMRQVVTSYFYSVTRGKMSSSVMDNAKSLCDKETHLALFSRYLVLFRCKG